MDTPLINLENRLSDFFENKLPFSNEGDIFIRITKSLFEKIKVGILVTDGKKISPNIFIIEIDKEHQGLLKTIPNWVSEIKELIREIIQENDLSVQGPVVILHEWKNNLNSSFHITIDYSKPISGNTIRVSMEKELGPSSSNTIAMLIFTNGEKFSLEKRLTTIGRAEENDLFIDNLLLSRNHAKISLEGNNILITDLNSLNGTFVNGNKIKKHLLLSGDVIRLGDISMIFSLENDFFEKNSTVTKKIDIE